MIKSEDFKPIMSEARRAEDIIGLESEDLIKLPITQRHYPEFAKVLEAIIKTVQIVIIINFFFNISTFYL